jgi:cytochrome c biogenesis protein CcmG, thiol:disulfide interchange protein DsbE
MLRRLLPLLVFLALGALLFAGVRLAAVRDPNAIPSPLIGKAAPSFSLPSLHEPERVISDQDLRGRPYLLNVWGSWCPTCRIEHPIVAALARSGRVRVIGFNYKDARDDALRWLQQFGDPYEFSLVDLEGRKAIDFGVTAAPESFLIDAQGVVLYKVTGPLTPDLIEREILPRLAAPGAGP